MTGIYTNIHEGKMEPESKKVEKWNVSQPGGPAGLFYSIVSETGRVIAMQIPDEQTAYFIAELPELKNKLKILRAGFRWQVDALETLQAMLDSHNEDNPWLGIAAALALEQAEAERLGNEVERLTAATSGMDKLISACECLSLVFDTPGAGDAEIDLMILGKAARGVKKALSQMGKPPAKKEG